MTIPSRLFVVFCLAAVCSLVASAQEGKATKSLPDETKAFSEFSANVQEYMKIHNRADKAVPKLKDTASPELIAAHQRALAEKIRHDRKNARLGDIFAPDVVAAFRHAIEREFQGSHAKNARATIQQGEPIKNIHLEVNQIYPQALPYTSLPPTLLLKFPKLPSEVAYRIVDRDLILLDVKANLVIDILPKALP